MCSVNIKFLPISRDSSDKRDGQLIREAAYHAIVYHSISGTMTTSSHNHEIMATSSTMSTTAEMTPSTIVDHNQFSFWNLSVSQRVTVWQMYPHTYIGHAAMLKTYT